MVVTAVQVFTVVFEPVPELPTPKPFATLSRPVVPQVQLGGAIVGGTNNSGVSTGAVSIPDRLSSSVR